MEIYAQIPAQYSEEDPLDVQGMKHLVSGLHTAWWMEPPDVQRAAIANALRAALCSPQQDLKWNSIVYQDLRHFGPGHGNPDAFENHIRAQKAKWDQMGQTTLDMAMGRDDVADLQAYAPHIVEKYQPGMWKSIRNAGGLRPYLEELRRAALDDIAQGGDGRLWRERVIAMNIPGVGPKITAFAWLLLNPEGSGLATIDVHMMRALNQDQESPLNLGHYHDLEDQLNAVRKNQGYNDIPLGVYQWAVWDHQRTHGVHQDHTPLRPLDPTHWQDVDWTPAPVPSRVRPVQVSPDQLTLARWSEAPQQMWLDSELSRPLWR